MTTDALRMSYDASSIKDLRWQVIHQKRKLLGKRVETVNEKIHRRRPCGKAVMSLMHDLQDIWEEENMLDQEEMTAKEIQRKGLDPDDEDLLEDELEDFVDWSFEDFIDNFCTFYPQVKWAIKERWSSSNRWY